MPRQSERDGPGSACVRVSGGKATPVRKAPDAKLHADSIAAVILLVILVHSGPFRGDLRLTYPTG